MEGLEGFKKELHKRMHFEEGSQDEDIYKSKKKAIQSEYVREEWHIPEGYIKQMNDLKKDVIMKQRSKYSMTETEFISNAVYFISVLNNEHEIYSEKIKNLPLPPLQTYRSRICSLFSGYKNKKADQINEYSKQIEQWNQQMKHFNDVKRNIELVLNVYNPIK